MDMSECSIQQLREQIEFVEKYEPTNYDRKMWLELYLEKRMKENRDKALKQAMSYSGPRLKRD